MFLTSTFLAQVSSTWYNALCHLFVYLIILGATKCYYQKLYLLFIHLNSTRHTLSNVLIHMAKLHTPWPSPLRCLLEHPPLQQQSETLQEPMT